MKGNRHKSNSGVKKRSSNACTRCRQQKIKCTGALPCAPCAKRSLLCSYDDSSKKVLVTKAYLEDLQRRADSHQSSYTLDLVAATSSGQEQINDSSAPALQDADLTESIALDTAGLLHDNDSPNADQQLHGSEIEEESDSSQEIDLVNPLIINPGTYISDYLGRKIHLGTTSNWAFARRVLSTACERLGFDAPLDPIYFEESVYSLDWSSIASASPSSHEDLMPSLDYAKYLVNTVKFHCGQMFHLFDEETFMRHFSTFHETENGRSKVPRLWYTHYLVLVALAKLLVARSSRSATPPGADLFLAAMQNWPELVFGAKHVVECVEVLICAALYLQCLDFRSVAFDMMGHAVRKALGQGLHTEINHRPPRGPVVQRCRRIWWTVYILDRQISTLTGLPQTIKDVDVSAPLPSFNTFKDNIGLDIHVQLSRVIAEIANTVYSADGRLPRKFLSSTKQALQNIAKITDLLSRHIEMPKHLSRGGISRFGAYLHLLHHQCICLTTRPLAYSFLDRRLQGNANGPERIRPRGSVQVLLRMCISSAQQMLHILNALKGEGLLESFLPFDLEAVFIASMILIMAGAIDDQHLEDNGFWTSTAYSILDDMGARGNMIALARKQELQHLANILNHTTPGSSIDQHAEREPVGQENYHFSTLNVEDTDFETQNHQSFHDPFWQDEMAADKLREIAHSLDLDGFDWMTASLDDPST